VITVIVLVLANLTIGSYQRRLEDMATTDKLTGATSRQMFGMIFDHALLVSKRQRGALSVIFFDIDRFKTINDTHGHAAGDMVIQSIVDTARKQVREADSIFRWGGEEFLLLLPDCDLQHAARSADKIRRQISEHPVFVGDGAISVAISLGVAEWRSGESADDLVMRADRALYAAKQNGRNRIEIAA
jgi:diguanylate cyclase (GGDEF)-like protein